MSWWFPLRNLCETHEKLILLRLESYNTESWSEPLMSFAMVGCTHHCGYHAPIVPPHSAQNLGPSHESQNKGGIRDHGENDVDKNERVLSRRLVCSVTDLFLGELGCDCLGFVSKSSFELEQQIKDIPYCSVALHFPMIQVATSSFNTESPQTQLAMLVRGHSILPSV